METGKRVKAKLQCGEQMFLNLSLALPSFQEFFPLSALFSNVLDIFLILLYNFSFVPVFYVKVILE